MLSRKLYGQIRKVFKKALIISLSFMIFSSCAGMDPKEVEQWISAGIDHPPEIETWKAFGFGPIEAVDWGRPKKESNPLWYDKHGHLKFEARWEVQWRNIQFNAVQAYWWKRAGFSADEARKWSNTNIPVGYDTTNLNKTGLSQQDVQQWIDINVLNLDQMTKSEWERKRVREDHSLSEALKSLFAKQWENAGLSPEETNQWIEPDIGAEGIRILVEVIKWKNAGFNPQEAKEWNYVGIGLEEVLKWKSTGFGPRQAAEWKRTGLSPEEAKREAKKQEETKEREQRRRAQIIESLCPKGVEEFPELIRSNPFDVKGRCFKFTGEVFQILNRTSALYTRVNKLDLGHNMDRTWYLNFGNNSVPNVPFFQGYVKGEGVFEYITVMGAKQVIPKLKVINLE